MQSLRLVGPGEDGTTVVLEALDGEQRFTLPLDERLRNVSLGQTPESPAATPPDPAPPGQALSPREIQTRVRAGEAPQAVAEAAGMPLEKVMRFASPVLAERTRVVEEAKRARARRTGEGNPAPFGDLIAERLARHGVDPGSVRWDAYRRPDGGWTVAAGFRSSEQDRQAKFSFGLTNRTVSALDALGADLLSDRPVRALLPPDPEPVADLTDPGQVTEPMPVRLAAVPDRPDADPAGTDADEPGLAASPAVRPFRRQKAHTRPIPVDSDDELFDQEAFDNPGDSWPEPALPLELAAESGLDSDYEPGEGRHRRNRRSDKPRMPSWDDILLGVRHKD